jgi:hypothetical protein
MAITTTITIRRDVKFVSLPRRILPSGSLLLTRSSNRVKHKTTIISIKRIPLLFISIRIYLDHQDYNHKKSIATITATTIAAAEDIFIEDPSAFAVKDMQWDRHCTSS